MYSNESRFPNVVLYYNNYFICRSANENLVHVDNGHVCPSGLLSWTVAFTCRSIVGMLLMITFSCFTWTKNYSIWALSIAYLFTYLDLHIYLFQCQIAPLCMERHDCLKDNVIDSCCACYILCRLIVILCCYHVMMSCAYSILCRWVVRLCCIHIMISCAFSILCRWVFIQGVPKVR